MSTANEYRPSASVILAYKTQETAPPNYDYNYQVLLIKRTPKTAYFQDHCVFPGGSFELNDDESLDWLEYFAECGITLDHLKCFSVAQANRPHPLLTTGRNFSRDISLRITAIRETFEEVGVLLCRKRGFRMDPSKVGGCGFAFEDIEEREYWQQEVHEDASKFLLLCRHLQVVPDLWSLHEWSVWRSPKKSSRKFDTVYYFVALEEQPSLLIEKSEAETSMWLTPVEALKIFKNRSIWLPHILFYELCRLTNAANLAELVRFCERRAGQGCSILQPAYYSTEGEYRIATLTGDDFNPTAISNNDFQKQSKHVHRIVFYDLYDNQIECNIPPADGHLSPLPKVTHKSKL